MSDTEGAALTIPDDDLEPGSPGYKPPAEKSLNAILDQDKEDESLARYKAALLGEICVILMKLCLPCTAGIRVQNSPELSCYRKRDHKFACLDNNHSNLIFLC